MVEVYQNLYENMDDDVSHLVNGIRDYNVNYEDPKQAYWFLNSDAFAELILSTDLENIKRVPLKDLLIKSDTSRTQIFDDILNSELILCSRSTCRYLILLTDLKLDRLNFRTQMLLAKMMKELGVTNVQFVTAAMSTGRVEGLAPGSLVLVSDYLNRSYGPFLASTLENSHTSCYANSKFTTHRHAYLPSMSSNSQNKSEKLCMVYQSGPAKPSDANVSLYRQTGQDLVTVISTLSIDMLNSQGVMNTVWAVVTDRDMQYQSIDHVETVANTLFHTLEDLSEIQIRTQMITEEVKSQTSASAADFKTIKIQIESDEFKLNETLNEIKKDLNTENVSKTAIIALPGSRIYKSLSLDNKCETINHFELIDDSEEASVVASLYHLKLQDKEFLLLQETPNLYKYSQNPLINPLKSPTYNRTMPTRLLVLLGITHFIVIGPVFGLDPEIKYGDLCIPDDQFGMSVVCPTIGPNLDTCGRRFYDCSHMYANGEEGFTVSGFEQIAEELGLENVHVGGVIYTNGSKSYAGLSEQRFGQAITSSVKGYTARFMAYQGYEEVMAIRHMDFDDKLKAVYVGVAMQDIQSCEIEILDPDTYTNGICDALKIAMKVL